jgi:hypothetical protein
MQITTTNITLPEGPYNFKLQFFTNADIALLKLVYKSWNDLSTVLEANGGRRLNIPEFLSEGIYSLVFNAGRKIEKIKGQRGKPNTSFDCFNVKTGKRIQVKACSVSEDLTSFGPKTQWDELYFVHFLPTNKYDGSYEIYLINNNDIYNQKVNKTQTMRDVQLKGKRPRFSIIKEIIRKKNLKPIQSGKL